MVYKSIGYNIVLAQTGVALVLAFACTVIWGWSTASAVLIGAAIGVVTNLYMAVRVFGGNIVRSAEQALQRFYAAEAMKIVMTTGLFALAFGALGVAFLPLIIGYSLTLVVYWLALLPVWPKPEPK
jgi:ATP synthase protein I